MPRLGETFDEASVRHFFDAGRLAEAGRFDNAGHLIGFAAECAIKHAFGLSGPVADHWKIHLPQLAGVARKHAQGRRSRQFPIVNLLEQLRGRYFDDWSVNQRYHRDGTVSAETYDRWRKQARRTLLAASIRIRQ